MLKYLLIIFQINIFTWLKFAKGAKQNVVIEGKNCAGYINNLRNSSPKKKTFTGLAFYKWINMRCVFSCPLNKEQPCVTNSFLQSERVRTARTE